MLEKEQTKEQIKEVLRHRKLICDGAFGTYYAMRFDTKELPEMANTFHPERVREIHAEYIAAGAEIIRTNTYACNTAVLREDLEEVQEKIRQAYFIAKEAAEAGDGKVYVAADIGPIPYENVSDKERIQREYAELCRAFLAEGADFFLFETFSDLEDILPAISLVGEKAFVLVQFSVNQFGYSNAGLSARKLMEEAARCKEIDAAGFNCGVGPGHMQKILRNLELPEGKFLTALPNAGYPQTVSNRMIFSNENIDYFASKVNDIALDGADIVGGCCGTTPEYIRKINRLLDRSQPERTVTEKARTSSPHIQKDNGFYAGKEGRKLVAVELAPPMGSDDAKLMDAAHLLKQSGVDVLTFPDSPSGRTRADSILMAEKVSRETGICVMPHICCRDKNAIAMRSQLLGAYINQIHNFLVITGDPIPSMVRASVKSVFNFDSVGLMQIISDMNEDQFAAAPVSYGGAINQGRRNLEVEIGRVKKKMEAGATFFLTQPVSSKEGVERVRKVWQATGARILCGIMPFVSLKNALFMKNEMAGIDVTDEVLARYRADMTREEGEQAGIALAREIISMTEDFVDGYYFSFPFNRVHMLKEILKETDPG